MPTDQHQVISRFLFLALYALIEQMGGMVLYAPLRLQIRPGKFREPDLLLVRNATDPRRQNTHWLGADLVIEIVSPDDPDRDLIWKRSDYAEASIPEYWIVNPEDATVTVLQLVGDEYAVHGVFQRGDLATSVLLAEFAVAVTDLFQVR